MAEGGPVAPRALLLDPVDNVAVAVRDLQAGDKVLVTDRVVTTRDAIGVGHKVAIDEILAGSPVRKYAEVIGIATAPIAAGQHVHVHNVVSARLPGPEQHR